MILLNGKPVRGFGVGEQFPANVTIAAQAAATALNTDPNFCRSVQQPGTPTNAALQAFKLAWNSMPGKYIPAGIFYDDQAAWALGQVVGTAPVACSEGLQKSPPPNQTDGRNVAPPPYYVPPYPAYPASVLIKALEAGVVGGPIGAGIGYAVSKPANRWSRIWIGSILGGVVAISATYLYWGLRKSDGEQFVHAYKGYTIKITCGALGSSDCVAGWNTKIDGILYSDQVVGQTNSAVALSAAQAKIDAYLPGIVPG